MRNFNFVRAIVNLHICDVCVTADWIRASGRCAAPNFEFAWSEHSVLDCARGLSSFLSYSAFMSVMDPPPPTQTQPAVKSTLFTQADGTPLHVFTQPTDLFGRVKLVKDLKVGCPPSR